MSGRASADAAFTFASRIIGAIGLGATAACWAFYAGPYRWLAEVQLAWFGAYRPLLTCALTLLVLTLAPVGVLYVWLRRRGAIQASDPNDLGTPVGGAPDRGTLGYLVALIVLLGFSIGGAAQLWRIRGRSDAHRVISGAMLENREPGSRFVTLQGKLRTDRPLSYIERGREDVRREFVPLVPAQWSTEDPVRFLVAHRHYGQRETSPRSPTVVSVTGLLDTEAIPRFVTERSPVRLASPYYVLTPEAELPSGDLGFGLICTGVLLAAALCAITMLRYRTGRKSS